tara:strand:+ start:968 stop:1165 length:198 start_codon:yes stop_codon:yes gene_type:complete
MTHPLTDEICDQIQDSVHPCDPENMRASADWQLAQCLDYIRTTQGDNAMVPFMEAMRPTKTQEVN